jgi:hypothetical protein
MTDRNKEEYNTYMKEYMLNRYYKRRKTALDMLGHRCNICKCEINDKFEIDHIDRTDKSFTISGKTWNVKEEAFLEELKKCQILCQACHKLKTIDDLGQSVAKGNHGTISTYRYCRCELCKDAKKKRSREDYLKRKLKNK